MREVFVLECKVLILVLILVVFDIVALVNIAVSVQGRGVTSW